MASVTDEVLMHDWPPAGQERLGPEDRAVIPKSGRLRMDCRFEFQAWLVYEYSKTLVSKWRGELGY